MKTQKVAFRVWKTDGEVIAFLTGYECRPYEIMSYMHIGQHGEADYLNCLKGTRLATPSEYKELLAELESIGYDNLKVVKRLTHNEAIGMELTK